MLVTSIQLPLGIQGSEGPNVSMNTEEQEVFQNILFQVLNSLVEDSSIVPTIGENVEIPMPDLEEEDFKKMINPFMLLTNYLDIAKVDIKEPQIEIETNLDYATIKGIDLLMQEGSDIIAPQLHTIPLIPEEGSLKEIGQPSIELPDREFLVEKAIDPRKIINDYKEKEIPEENHYKQIEKVEEAKEEETPRVKDIKFNTLVMENRGIKQIPKTINEEQVLSKENIQNINNSIIKLVETTTEGQTSMMKVQLYPEDLGTINVVLKMDEGKIIAKIMVDNDNIKQIFNSKINELSENLIKQNIHMEKVDIELNPNLNLNSNSDFSEGFNGNNRNNLKRNQSFRFEKESTKTVTLDEKNLSSGAISILA